MTIRHFEEWRAYADLEPFDETRADLRAADIIRTLLNIELVRHRKRPTVKLKDCLLDFAKAQAPEPVDPARVRAEVEKTMAILMAIYNQPKAKDKGKR